MTRQDYAFKWFLYALGVVPVWIAETMFLNRMPVLGVIPVLLPLTAVAVGLLEGPYPGALFGLCVGVAADAVYPGLPGGMTLGVTLLGAATGILSDLGLRQNYLGYLLCASGSMAALEVLRLLAGLLSRLARPAAIMRVALLEAMWSLCFTLPIYGIFRLIYHRVGRERLGG